MRQVHERRADPARVLLAAALLATVVLSASCGGPASPPQDGAQPATPVPAKAGPAARAPAVDPDLADENTPLPRSAGNAPRALLPSNATGCAPGTRCLRVARTGRPQATGMSIAQCRGTFADFIVPKNTVPAGYGGPWFKPDLIESAQTGIPGSARPWTSVDPRDVASRLAYLLTLRNYAFSSASVRQFTPALTADADYLDTAGGAVPADQGAQKWYPAPRMTYGLPSRPGTREAARGMTLERAVPVNELGGNTARFVNYAVAYYDARGARTYARVWSGGTPGVDTPDVSRMRFTEGALVFKLIFSAARPSDFPTDLLAGSVAASILPNPTAVPLTVRLLQMDIAVKDNRAGPTGWYFATFAFDRAASATSPWRKMTPVGLMWGNDGAGAPIDESWINPSAPAYAKAHLGVGGRLNGPVDNPASACMSCHSTAQAPTLANMLAPSGGNTCVAMRSNWFRNLPGTQAFGRFDPQPSTCETALDGITLTAADYSLQLAETVTDALPTASATFNPCTWDAANPPSTGLTPAATPRPSSGSRPPRVFPVTRDPQG